MSFLGVLKSVGHVFQLGVTEAAAHPDVVGKIPVIGSDINIVVSLIVGIENLVGAGRGPAKKAAVTASVMAAAPDTEPETLSQKIDDIVKALNDLAAAGEAIQRVLR